MPRMTRPVLGLDIGGANLKAAHTSGAAKSVPFALWRDPGGLDAALGRLVAEMPPFDVLAVTMTGELCDCFASKREGVNHILDAVEGRSKTVRVWTNEGAFVDVPTARPRGAQGGVGELAGAGDVRGAVRAGGAGAAN